MIEDEIDATIGARWPSGAFLFGRPEPSEDKELSGSADS